MQAGFYDTDITPDPGMEQPGGYGKAYIERIHDPLKARAAVFEEDGCAVAFVGLDTCAAGEWLTQRVRGEVERLCGFPGSHLMLAASHTHSGGPLFGLLPEQFADADDLVRELIRDHSTLADPGYAERVARQTVTAVCEAWRRREEVTLRIGRGREEQAACNRRFRMRNGRVYTHPGKGNPDILEPAGPIDPEVGVVSAWNRHGSLLGCLVNYACHCTTFSGGVSADWVCYLEQVIRGALGADAGVVFLNGACGDVTQVDNRSLRAPEFGEVWSRYVGMRVGAEAVKAMVSTPPVAAAPLRAAVRTLCLARRPQDHEKLEAARRRVESGLRNGARDTAWTFAKERLILAYLAGKSPEVQVEIQALQVGSALFLANPAELFCALGLQIKRESPFPYTWVVELANGCAGYVPPEEAFAPGGGGYETVLTSYSSLAPGAGRRIVEASLELAREMPSGIEAAPSPAGPVAELAAPGQPWSYGVLGPDRD